MLAFANSSTHIQFVQVRVQRRLFRQVLFVFFRGKCSDTDKLCENLWAVHRWMTLRVRGSGSVFSRGASERATCSSSPEGSRMGLGFSKASVPVIHLDIVPSHITTFQKNMIQCKMFLFCFLHCDSSNNGKTHAWETKRSRNYLLLRIVWPVRPFLTFFSNSNLARPL